MAKPDIFSRGPGLISEAIHALVSQIPVSSERVGDDPTRRAHEIAKNAAIKSAAVSGSFSLPFGPLGLATVIPDLLSVWRIQQQLVADVAAAYGRTDALTKETMIYCLFKHGGAAVMHRFFSRSGDDVVVQRIAHRTLQQLLEKIAIRLTQRLAAKSVSRWLPILGALGAGAYAYYDTTHVGSNAIELFSKDVRFDDTPTSDEDQNPEAATNAAAAKPVRKRGSESAATKSSKSEKSAPKSTRTPVRRPKSPKRSNGTE
jgi:hypothetical protein